MSMLQGEFRNKHGEVLEPSLLYNFGGNVSSRFTGTKRRTFYIWFDDTGEIRKSAGPAGRDAIG